MRRIELLFGYIAIIGISLLIGSQTFDSNNAKSLILPIGFFAVISVVLALAHFASKGSGSAQKLQHHTEVPLPSSAGLTQDNSALLGGLNRIEERLAKLENIKPIAPLNPTPALQELKELQAKAYADIHAALAELKNRPWTNSGQAPVLSEDKLGELSGALSEAMKEISKRDGSIDALTANVTRTNIQRILTRISQGLEVARSLQMRVADGKSTASESFEFILDDLNSGLSDHGVESLEIAAGTRVADLPAGSFTAISVVDAPEESLRGTVKEARSRSYFLAEEGKMPRYIAPAKVILYRS